MVNSELKNATQLAEECGSAADGELKRNLATNAALTTQTIDVRHPQKLFWPSRFMVY
jgi:hypothetical protein